MSLLVANSFSGLLCDNSSTDSIGVKIASLSLAILICAIVVLFLYFIQ